MAGFAAAGLLVVAPVLVGQQAAGAADMSASAQKQLTFIDTGGVGVTCTVDNFSDHNTDDPNQPDLSASIAIDGPADCQNARYSITLTYKDKSGVARTSFATGLGSSAGIDVEGAYGPFTTTVSANFLSCDSARSATCQASVTTAPK